MVSCLQSELREKNLTASEKGMKTSQRLRKAMFALVELPRPLGYMKSWYGRRFKAVAEGIDWKEGK